MYPTPKPPPMVVPFTAESLSRRDPARRYGRWFGLVLMVLLLVSVFIPGPDSFVPLSHLHLDMGSSWASPVVWRSLILPLAGGILALIGTCLPRRPRGVLYCLGGALVIYSWAIVRLLPNGPVYPPSEWLHSGFWMSLILVAAMHLVVGGFDAARRDVSRRARRWAALAPALAVAAGFAGQALLLLRFIETDALARQGGWRTLSHVWFRSLIHGVEGWLPIVMTIVWTSAAVATIVLAILQAFRGKRTIAKWGLVCSLILVGLPVILSPIRELAGYTMTWRGADGESLQSQWYQANLIEEMRNWFPYACGAGLLILGYSTLWPVRRAKNLPTLPPCDISVGPENGNTTTTRQ